MSKIMYNGQEYSSGVNYGSVLPMSPSDSTKVDAAINSKADASTTYTKTEVDNLLPVYIKQTAGTSIQMQVIATFFYYYATQWGCYIPYPFICKNTNYSVSLDEIIAENVGNITSKCTLVSKSPCFCTIRTDNTMSSFPNYWSACVARCKITITFA